MALPDLLVGVAVGIASGLLSWWIVARAGTPLITISPRISKSPPFGTTSQGFRYSVKYRNQRRWWLRSTAAVEVRLTATLRVLVPDSDVWMTWTIPLTSEGTPLLLTHRMTDLRVENATLSGRSALALRLRETAKEAPGSLEALMALGSDACVRFVVSAASAYTGSRRTYWRDYSMADIVEGTFERESKSMRIQPLPVDKSSDARNLSGATVADSAAGEGQAANDV